MQTPFSAHPRGLSHTLWAHTPHPAGRRVRVPRLYRCGAVFRAVSTPLGGLAQADSSRCANPFVCLCVWVWLMVYRLEGARNSRCPAALSRPLWTVQSSRNAPLGYLGSPLSRWKTIVYLLLLMQMQFHILTISMPFFVVLGICSTALSCRTELHRHSARGQAVGSAQPCSVPLLGIY